MPRRSVFCSALVILASFRLASCARPGEATQADQEDAEAKAAETKAWWTGRVAGALSNGRPKLTDGELAELAKKPEAEIVDTLMARSEFKEALIAFNLDYLGFRSDKLKYPDGSLFSTFTSLVQFPSAIAAAEAVAADGDFFTVLDFKQPFYAPPLSTDALVTDGVEGQPIAVVRKAAFEKTRQLLVKLLADLEAKPETPYYEVCDTFFTELDFNTLLNIGLSFDFVNSNSLQFLVGPIGRVCSSFAQGQQFDAKQMLTDSLTHWNELEIYVEQFHPSVYKVTDLASLKTYDLVKLGFATPETKAAEELKFASMWFWKAMVNSSTNFNRKRASYVLKRFFCDDLTPIAVETPMEHAEGKHATDASCQACHYKLDPMAGFFRYNGMQGEDFAAKDQLIFDDRASVKMSEYLKSWHRPDGSLDVGYIRSVNNESLNDRSANPENPGVADLFAIIKAAPEARQCLVKTMMRFLVGENVALDAGYVEFLSGEFGKDVEQAGSGAALKATMKRILVSNSFRETNPVENECYDYAPGVDPAGLPPCKVARILEKNCASCHNATGAQGGLDLSSWKRQSDGFMGFTNDGVAAKDTFQAISDRLSATDEGVRMPLKQHMAPVEREELYLWLSEQLAAKEATP